MAPLASLGVERSFGWAPTDDPGQLGGPDVAAIYNSGRGRIPSGFTWMGHVISVNLATGALSITVTDRSAPYHGGAFAVVRSYDAQEQFAQSDYRWTHPNTDPRLHFFGNWTLDQETSVSATWHRSYAELLIGSGSGGSLVYRGEPAFAVHEENAVAADQRLRAWGIPGCTLQLLGWRFEAGDLMLKTRQGGLSILCGSYAAETLIDQVEAELWRFDPPIGSGERYTSVYSYQQLIDVDGLRETNVPIVRSLATDSLAHTIAFQPVGTQPPYRTWMLADGAGRRYELALEDYVTYLDGNNPGGFAKTYVVTSVIDQSAPQSAPIAYAYDGSGRLVAVDYPPQSGGGPRRYSYAYDDRGALLSITDPGGDSISFSYIEDDIDLDDRLLPRLKVQSIVDGEGNEIAYQYDYTHSVTTATTSGSAGDTRQVAVRYIEDTTDTHQRYLASQTVTVARGYAVPQTVVSRSSYSTDGRFLLIKTVDPVGAATTFEYNDLNQTIAVIDALGHRRELRYDVTSAPTPAAPNRYDLVGTFETSLDAAGTSYPITTGFDYLRYDAESSPDPADAVQSTHRMSARIDPLGRTWTRDYDDPSNYLPVRPTSYTDPLGNVSTRTYDDRGSILSSTDAIGNTSKWSYDPLGRLLSATDPNGNTRHWLYDPSTGWLTTATDALGAAGDPAHSITYKWNDSGQQLRQTDAVGARTEYGYSASTRLRSVTQYDPVARTTDFTFDGVGNLTDLTNPTGAGLLIRYDEINRVYEIAYSGVPGQIAYTRDLAGRVTQMTDANGSVTTYVYDLLGRLSMLQEPDWPAAHPANAGKRIIVTYDPQGRRLTVGDSELGGSYTYEYDAVGNLVKRSNPDGSVLQRDYDARNALVRLHDGSGSIDLTFALDHNGQLESLTDSGILDPARTFVYHRQAAGSVDNLYAIDYDTSGLTAKFDYDANRHVTLTEFLRAAVPLATYGYAYREDGLVGGESGARSASYDYDGRKQLIHETASASDGYDPAGNRLWRGPTAPPPSQQATFDAQNRMLTDGHGVAFAYDANGNVVSRTDAGGGPATTYAYDGANRLRIVDDGSTIVRYTYDSDGRLVERVAQRGVQSDRRSYLYGNRTIVAELDGQGNIAALHTRDNDGRLLRLRTPATVHPRPSQDQHSLFYLSDGLGNVVRLVDWDGTVHVARDYDAWGEGTRWSQFGFRGAYEDAATGLVSFGARWYDPTLGRWLSQDPLLALLGGANSDLLPSYAELSNLYTYAFNDPVRFWDVTGYQPSDYDLETGQRWTVSPAGDKITGYIREVWNGDVEDISPAFAKLVQLRQQPENYHDYDLAVAADYLRARLLTYKYGGVAATTMVNLYMDLKSMGLITPQGPGPVSPYTDFARMWMLHGVTLQEDAQDWYAPITVEAQRAWDAIGRFFTWGGVG